MTAWLPVLRWFAPRVLLLLATLLAPGCGYATYQVAPAELQRLTLLPPSQRGEHIRVYTPDVVPVETPAPPVAGGPIPVDLVVDAAELELPAPEVVVDLAFEPPRFIPAPPPVRGTPRSTAHLPPRTAAGPHLPATSTTGGRPPSPAVPPRLQTPSPGHIPTPVVAGHPSPLPGRGGGGAPTVPAHGGHPAGVAGAHHSGGGGGGGGDAAVAAVVGVVLLVGLIAVIAASSQPDSFDGWIRSSPEQPVHLVYASSLKRDIRLCDLKPADLAGVRSAMLYPSDGRIERLESAANPPPSVAPPRLALPPAPTPNKPTQAPPPPLPQQTERNTPTS